jgi:uncharacterized membrane protein YidH (DUF202 family)
VTGHRLLDAGAQAERTALAWQRTGFSAMAIGALLVHGHVEEHLLPLWPGLLLMGIAAGVVLVFGPRRYRRVLAMVSTGQTPLSRRMVPGAALVTLIVTLGVAFGIAAELLSPW